MGTVDSGFERILSEILLMFGWDAASFESGDRAISLKCTALPVALKDSGDGGRDQEIFACLLFVTMHFNINLNKYGADDVLVIIVGGDGE